MNKKVLSFLFTLIGMLVGTTSAWAETVNAKIAFPAIETDVTVSEALDYKGEVGSMAIPVSNAAFYLPTTGWLRLGDGAATVTIPEAQRATSSDVVTVSFDMAWGNKSNMGSGFYLKDSEGEYIASFQMARWDAKGTNANSLNIDMTGLVGGHASNKAVIGNATHFDITVSYAAKTITSVVTFGENSNTFTSDLTNTKSIASFEVFGYGAGNNADRASIFNNLVISTRSSIKKFQDYSDGVADWTSGNTGRYTVDMNEGKYLTVNAVGDGSNGATITGTTVNQVIPAGEDFASSDNFTMSFDLQLTGGNNQASSFYINDAGSTTMLGLEATAANSTVWKINGSETQTLDLAKATWYSFKLTKSDAKLYLTVVPTAGGDALMNQQLITVNSTVGGLGNMIFNTKRYYAFMAIDNVLVRDVVESEDIPATPIYTYTVKYVDQDDSEFKDPSIREEYAGVELAITDDDKATVVVGNSQYTYVSDDAAGQTAVSDGSTVITVKFSKTTVTNYTVNFFDTSNGIIKDAVTHKNVLVGSEVSATAGELSKILKEGVFYEYASGNEPLTLVEDAAANVINLYFAPVDGVTGYFFNSYENRAVDWTEYINGKTGSGRYDPVVVDGSTIADRATTEKKPVVDQETGETVGYEEVPGLSIPFANKSYFLGVNQAQRNASGGSVLKSNAFAVNQTDFTFEAKVLLGSANETNQNLTSFTIRNFAGDANILSVVSARTNEDANLWVINNDAENLTVTLPNSGVFTGTDNSNYSNYSWYNFKITVYNALTFLTITDTDGNVIFDKKQIPTLATSYGVGEMEANMGRYYANFAIDDVTVRSVVVSEDVPSDAKFVAVKINYVDEAKNVLKPADEQNFKLGDKIELNSAFTADFKVDAEGNVWTAESESAPVTKYIYVSDNSADVPAALGAEVDVVFRGVAPRNVGLRYQYQTIEGEIKSVDAAGKSLPYFYRSNTAGDVLFEKDILTVYYPYYLLVDGLLYKTAANGGGTDKIELEIEPGTGTQTKTPVTWTPAMETGYVIDPETGEPAIDPETQEPVTEEVQIKNAVFAQETENIAGITPVKDGYTQIRMANGAAGSAIGGDVLVTTLEPGTYTITTATRSGTTNFKAAGNVVATIYSGGSVETITSPEFTVDQATPLYIEEQASTSQYNDYVLVRKTKALESYTISVAEGIENGTVSVATSAAEGAEITITATPDEGYELASLTVTGEHEDLAVIVTDGKFIMPADDVTVNATFRQVYKVNIAEGIVGGTVEVDPASAKAGDEVTITATSTGLFGGEVASISVTGVNGNEAVEVTDGKFIMPADDVTVNVTFNNPESPTVYMMDVESGKFYSRGKSWGTQGITDDYGYPVNITLAGDKYEIRMYDWTSTGLGDNFFTDNGTPLKWEVAKTEEGFYTFKNGDNYLSVDADNLLGYSATARNWAFLTQKAYEQALVLRNNTQFAAALTAAGVESLDEVAPKDVTESVKSAALAGSIDGWTKTMVADNNFTTNEYATESFYATGSLTQTVEGLAKGLYKVTIQGFNRAGRNADVVARTNAGYNLSTARIIANGNEALINSWGVDRVSDTNPNSMKEASDAFAQGKYVTEVYTAVGEDGKLDLTISWPSRIGDNWFICKNLKLTYFTSEVTPEDVEALIAQVPEGKMNNDVQTILSDAKTALESAATVANYKALQVAIEAANTSIENYEEAKVAIDAADKLDEVGKALYNSNEKVLEIKGAYEAGTLVEVADEDLALMKEAFLTAVKAQTTPGADMSILMETASYTCPQGNGPGKYQDIYTETYSTSPYQAGKVIYQTIEGLTPGTSYEVKFLAVPNVAWIEAATGDGIAQAYANDATYDITVIAQTGCTPTDYERTLTAVVGEDGVLEFGIQNIAEGGNWYVEKGVGLKYLGIINPINIALGIQNGTVTGPASAPAGETVTLTVTPDEGYELATLTITDGDQHEIEYDEWDYSFEMPASPVYVIATFQQVYVKLSDYAVTTTGVIDEEGFVKASVTYVPEATGSYATPEVEGSLETKFYYQVIDDANEVAAEGEFTTYNPPFGGTIMNGEVYGTIPNLVAGTEYKLNITRVEVLDYTKGYWDEEAMDFVVPVVFEDARLDGYLATTTFKAINTPVVEPLITELNVERYTGLGYTVTNAEVDFSEAEEFLGINGVTADMLRIVNPDGTTISDYAPYDGWFDGDGKAETWGANTKINVKFFQAIPEGKYTICDMNGADVVDNTYTVRWAIEANDKVAIFKINVKFVEAPVIDYTFEDLNVIETVDVNLTSELGKFYEGLKANVDVQAILNKLGENGIDDVAIFAVLSDGTLDSNYQLGTTDGWRNAAGDWQGYGDAAFFYVKANFAADENQIYEVGGMEGKNTTAEWESPATYTATYAFVKPGDNHDAVVLKVNLAYTVPTGIESTPAADGVKPDGKYFENGKIVIYKNGNKYDASGAPMNK